MHDAVHLIVADDPADQRFVGDAAPFQDDIAPCEARDIRPFRLEYDDPPVETAGKPSDEIRAQKARSAQQQQVIHFLAGFRRPSA